MSIIKCNECGADVSTEAKACPKCGAPPPKRTSLAVRLVVVLLGVTFVGVSVQQSLGLGPSRPEPTAEQKAASQAAARRATTAAAAMKVLRQNMRDPESLVWEDVRADADGRLVCLQYRARNGFGGMNREQAVVKDGTVSSSPSVWNKQCTQPLFDTLADAQRLLR